MKVYGITCSACGGTAWSRYRHDLAFCPCGKSYADGGQPRGSAYTRFGWYPPADPPKAGWLEVEDPPEWVGRRAAALRVLQNPACNHEVVE